MQWLVHCAQHRRLTNSFRRSFGKLFFLEVLNRVVFVKITASEDGKKTKSNKQNYKVTGFPLWRPKLVDA
jgi:hypothetical protein